MLERLAPNAEPTAWTELQSAWFDAPAGVTLPVKLPLNSSGMNVDVGWPAWPISGAAAAVAKDVVGAKPPWNQPQERPRWLSRSPMFWPFSATASRVEQSSQYGCASLVRAKPPWPSGVMSLSGFSESETLGPPDSWLVSTRPVSPEARLIAPGAEGPNVVPNELSLIA